MRNNYTLERLRSQQMAAGTWLQMCSVQAARLLAAQGACDWLMIDLEHTPLDRPTANQMYASIADVSHGRCTPIARLAGGTMEEIKHALDGGAQGVLVPMVNTAEQAASVVRFARYPPQGERGAGGLTPHLGFGAKRGEYLAQANEQILVGVQIETRQAVENVGEIAATPGLDLLFIGPFDLHISLGLPGNFWSQAPAFQHAVRDVLEVCQRRGLACGILCGNASEAKARWQEGFSFVGIATDAIFLLDTVGKTFGELHNEPEPPEGWANRVRID